MNFFHFILSIIYFFFECYNSKTAEKQFKWQELYITVCRIKFYSLILKKKGEAKINFKKLLLYAPNYDTLEYLFREIFVLGEYHHESTHEIQKIYDCGANIGFATLYFQTIYPDAQIYCFEPNPTALHYLNKNIESNNLQNVIVIPEALSDKYGEMDLHYSPNESVIGSLFAERHANNSQTINVKLSKLSDYLLKFGSGDLIKIDIEGAESVVLKDLNTNYKLNDTQVYFIEYHSDGSLENLTSFINFLPSDEYVFQSQSSYSKNTKQQDIVFYLTRK